MTAVWYIGVSAVRAISPSAWYAIGAPGDERVWSEANGWSIPTTAFTAEQLTYLGGQPDFDINGADGPRPGPADPYWVQPDEAVATKTFVRDQLSLALAKDKNLGDVSDPLMARTNIGLGGDLGTPGQPRYTGQGAPGTIIGAVPGDVYLDTTTGTLYTLQ